MGKVDARTVGAIIEARKKYAELVFKKGFVERNSPGSKELLEEVERELGEAQAKLTALEERASSSNVEIILPFKSRLDQLDAEISQKEPKEMDEALKAKEGALFTLLSEKGAIIRSNVEHRLEIGKLAFLLPQFPKEQRDRLRGMVEAGKAEEMPIPNNEKKSKMLIAVLNRLGLGCRLEAGILTPTQEDWEEGKVQLNNEYIWLDKTRLPAFAQNEKSIMEISTKLQVKNAERQVRDFGEEEMNEFNDLQSTYLTLLNMRKDLAQDYENELKEVH